MKSLSVLALLAGVAAVPVATRADGVTGTASTSWVSDYLFRGQRLSGAAIQSYVEADYSGVTLGVWESSPVGRRIWYYADSPLLADRPLADPEIDYYGSYNLKLAPTLALVPGFTFYTFPRAAENLDFLGGYPGQVPGHTYYAIAPGQFRSTFEPNLALIWTVAGVALSPKLYYDVTKQGFTAEFNASAAVPLRAIGTELDFTGAVGAFNDQRALDSAGIEQAGYDVTTGAEKLVTYPRTRVSGGYWQIQASLPYQFGPHWKASFGVGYSQGFSQQVTVIAGPYFGDGFGYPNGLQDRRVIATVSASYSF